MYIHVCVCTCRVAGALYGRALGEAMLIIWKNQTGTEVPMDTQWDWMDPGLIAVMGSASLLGGVTRLSLATTVIMVGPVWYTTTTKVRALRRSLVWYNRHLYTGPVVRGILVIGTHGLLCVV